MVDKKICCQRSLYIDYVILYGNILTVLKRLIISKNDFLHTIFLHIMYLKI